MVRGGEPGQFAAAPLPSVPPPRCPAHQHLSTAPGQQHLSTAPRPATSQHGAPPSNLSYTAPRPAISQYGAPASNKPHLAEKSTPVWLAIWRTWAGFANSQLRRANFPALIYIYASIPIAATLGCCSDRRKSFGPSAPIAYVTSVSPPDEAVAWPGAAFLQITARANPCSRHLWGTLARAVASI